MDERNRRAYLLGTIGAVVLLTLLFVAVGARRVTDSLLSADPAFVAATAGLACCWLAAWGLMLRTVLGALGVSLPPSRAIAVYAGIVFGNNVTPFGQAGGEPVAAALVSKVADARYETGLAAVASVDVLNVVPSLSLAFLGVGHYATTAAVGERLEAAVLSAAALGVGVTLVATVVWRRRHAIADRLPAVVAPRLGRLGGKRFDAEALEADLRERTQRFFENVARVATSRHRLAAALGFSLLGWLLQVAALAAAFAAVGHAAPLAVLVFAIPIANLAGAAPLPGGLGGIEAAFVAVLVPTTGINPSAVTAAILVFRGGTYWLPIVLGGVAVSAFGVRTVR